MNNRKTKYSRFALIKEMLETSEIIRNFQTKDMNPIIKALKKSEKLFLTGEGSSRIFPAKNATNIAQKANLPLTIYTQGSRQAAEFDLKDFVLFGASNSGKTKEVISLFKTKPAAAKFALTAYRDTPLESLSEAGFILSCGAENAVAATKSVIEQALFYHKMLLNYQGKDLDQVTLSRLADLSAEVLELPVEPEITAKIVAAPIIYFAGRNVGVAEEATLKTNEITRKKSAYLEGTYAVHGIEEVMDKSETVIVVNPYKEEEEKFQEVLVKGVGMNVIAIASRETIFPTIKIPTLEGFDNYLQLQMCWNLLVEVGIAEGINLDKPVRARKVGNEFLG
ncbi:MAG: sugar isomerase [Candidatus Marinimicrobia bacterium CG08_land_8_20_14_0_20_45_22]|nr:MAG: sugar isomerase [Candidatus Marinimicrobia bacterium CG08_land_8_20_14_0_20_45_22]